MKPTKECYKKSTKWRKGKYKIVTIIDEQALELSHVIKGIKSNFKGFVGRF